MRTRTVAVNIRVTDSEKKKLERAARLCRLSLSEYLRKVGLGKQIRAAPPPSLFEAYRLLTRLRDNRAATSGEDTDRSLEEAATLLLQAYHEFDDEQSGGETPWQ